MSALDLIDQILASLPPSRACNLPSTFFCVSTRRGPRWLFPSGPKLNHVLSSWCPYRLSSRLGWRVLQTAQHLGVTRVLPRVEMVEIDRLPGVNWHAVGWRGSTPPVPVIYVGTPGTRQKGVLHLVNPATGDCAAVVKVPLGAEADNAIVRESSVLTVLAGESYTAMPRLLFVDHRAGITAQSFVGGTSGSRSLLPEYLGLLGSLVLQGESTCLAGHANEWQRERLARDIDCANRGLLALAFTELLDTTRLPACWVHGDFAPWNIRHRLGRPPLLIDWEMAERGGLPLQDAFHFLHAQDFLFGKGPSSHSSDIEPFAASLGISSGPCRKLQIAYLVQSYLRAIDGQELQRAEFLMKALARTLQEQTWLRSRSAPQAKRGLRLVSSRSAQQKAVRAELFSSVIESLNRSRIPYCVLGGYDDADAASGSDVDIMFLPRDLGRVATILQQCGKSAGAQLVQSIRHETSARYFILARAEGKHIAYLALDCYGDYRRHGRTWLRADSLIAGCRRYNDFYRPGIGDGFAYLLIKKVLKQAFTGKHVKVMQHLFARNPAACRRPMARFWSSSTICQLERATVQGDLDWFRQNLPPLRRELLGSQKVQPRLVRIVERWQEFRRLLDRVLHPTGLSLLVVGEEDSSAQELADQLACRLAPAFRRTSRVCQPAALLHGIRLGLRLRSARLRSTLMTSASLESHELGRMRLTDRARRWLLSPDLTLHLCPDMPDAKREADSPASKDTIFLKATDLPETLLERANKAVLEWLATRTATRLKLPVITCEPEAGVPSPSAMKQEELEFVGSD